MSKKVITHAFELWTGAGVRKKNGRKITEEDLGIVSDGAIVYTSGKKIEWLGKTKDLPKKYLKLKKKNLKNTQSVFPGFVDCHTHMVFAGDRSNEFARRCAGATYEEIAKSGGGILSTLEPTRKASLEELFQLACKRVEESYSYGVRTLEIKSGYGLNLESELKQLEVVKKLRKKYKNISFQSTFMGAHAFPKEYTREEYMSLLLEKMIPAIAQKKLADACDVFVDQGYFTLQEARQIFKKAHHYGLKIKLHGDELANLEAAQFAVEEKALSVDHLLKVSENGIRALSRSETVAVLLPGTAFYLKAAYPPARALLDSGAIVALSTDFNPGSCMCNSLPSIMTLGALYCGMKRSEIFAAVTFNAAKALGLEKHKGTLEVGKDADVILSPFQRFEEFYYRFSWSAGLNPVHSI